MGAVGVICEYNPFHRGHQYHLAQIRTLMGPDTPILCAMSGNWVQRGSCALLDKWTRAALALQGGADLVLEIPTLWATSSAEGFAQGGVAVLTAAGVADALSFGSESGDTAALQAAAQCLDSDPYRLELRRRLEGGVSFPTARQEAVRALIGDAAAILSSPNDNLAVEYLRAAQGGLTPLAIPRAGAGHDGPSPAGGIASASYIRERLAQGEDMTDYLGYPLPNLPLAEMSRLERPILAQLKRMEEADWAALPHSGAAEGLPARLTAAARGAATLAGFYAAAKTKRYTLARLRRLVLWAFLGLRLADIPPKLPYLRVLGFNSRGQALLRQMKAAASLPILTKPAHAAGLAPSARRVFELESRCTDLYGLALDSPAPGGREWTQNPILA